MPRGIPKSRALPGGVKKPEPRGAAPGKSRTSLREAMAEQGFMLPETPAENRLHQAVKTEINLNKDPKGRDAIPEASRVPMNLTVTNDLGQVWTPASSSEDPVFRSVVVPYRNMDNVLSKRNRETGKRVFFSEDELDRHYGPQGWRESDPDDFPFDCSVFVESCSKKLRSAELLQIHIEDFHPSHFRVFKEELEELVKEESADRRRKAKEMRDRVRAARTGDESLADALKSVKLRASTGLPDGPPPTPVRDQDQEPEDQEDDEAGNETREGNDQEGTPDPDEKE